MAERQLVTLSSNWSSGTGTDLQTVLMDSPSDNVEIDIQDLNTDKFACLVNNGNTEYLKPYLEINVDGCITDVVLISEAQVIEVFGVNDEYLLTHTGELIIDFQEMAIYYSKISLPKIPVCKLKFTRWRTEEQLWIFGVKVHIQKMGNSHCERFNLEQIIRLMGNSQSSNLNNGNNFNKFLQFYFKNSSDYRSDLILPKRTATSINGSGEEKCVSDMMSRLQVNENWLKGYIDKKFLEMKEDILHEVDVKLNNLRDETNCKLDRIISILEKDRVRMGS